jgi:hypothetical protein
MQSAEDYPTSPCYFVYVICNYATVIVSYASIIVSEKE